MMSRFMKPLVLGGVAVAAICVYAGLPPRAGSPAAGEWPGFRGATNGNAPALPEADASKIKITKTWKVPTSTGFSSFAVAGGDAYTVVRREFEGNTNETLVALDVKTGKELWAKPLSILKYDGGGGDSGAPDNKGGDGPRSTPAVSDGKVYVIDAQL